MNDRITTMAELEAVIGRTPQPMLLKVVDHLDAGALRWIAQSPLMLASFGGASGVGITLAGGAPGFAGGDAHELRLPAAMLDDPALARAGAVFGSLSLLPGIGETLRVNDRLRSARASSV